MRLRPGRISKFLSPSFPLNSMSASNDLKGFDHGVQMLGRDATAAKDLGSDRKRTVENKPFKGDVRCACRVFQDALSILGKG